LNTKSELSLFDRSENWRKFRLCAPKVLIQLKQADLVFWRKCQLLSLESVLSLTKGKLSRTQK
jgi:hypothetical protein